MLRHANLDAYLANGDYRTLNLCGFCIESTLCEVHDLGLDAWIVADRCAAFTVAQHDHVLEQVVHHFGHATDSRAPIAAMDDSTCSS